MNQDKKYKKVIIGKKRRKRITQEKTTSKGMSLLSNIDTSAKEVVIDEGESFINHLQTK